MYSSNLITDADARRLRSLVRRLKSAGRARFDHIDSLKRRIGSARLVSPEDIPRNVVTMNSLVQLRDLDSRKRQTLTLADPFSIAMFGDRLSVAGPAGIALLGKRVGEVVSWTLGSKVRRLLVERVIYQPEAAGDFHL